MNPIYKTQILQGHGRPIKNIQFSKNGQFIFSASADRSVIKWDYQKNVKVCDFKHQASVNVICISHSDKLMFTGDSTGCIYIWDLETNSQMKKIEFDPCFNIRSIQISTDDKYVIVTLVQRSKNSQSFVNAYETEKLCTNEGEPKFFKQFECKDLNTKYVQSKFTNYNKSILISREDGGLEMINFESHHLISSNKFHNDTILDFDVNFEHGIILTASKDGYLCVINLNTFQLVRKFHPENPTRNLNACLIAIINNPYYGATAPNSGVISLDNLFDLNDDLESIIAQSKNNGAQNKFGKSKEIVLAITSGGQDSKFVTNTAPKEGGFDILIYNAMTGDLLASFLDHFGPVNSLSVYDKILASGAEDATVRIHKLEYYLFQKT